ncbi:hypothetical protein NEOLI_002798 [Neolecta irregularis DAH-3]|uniref:MICOS complex subunit MIC10 n=1 Tax=Neolecta irregularis (strain DAH-3) TaxID=1198029 RepID=A0A1U7LQH5_NEOID|nr:hypothetical protein NEOLI_002798 [Neolecta irregularis DAH-3]|eukprot:OLL24915.1 hypothetical protein NEOLI_002798 [Neolecta irregularis DAH-3]
MCTALHNSCPQDDSAPRSGSRSPTTLGGSPRRKVGSLSLKRHRQVGPRSRCRNRRLRRPLQTCLSPSSRSPPLTRPGRTWPAWIGLGFGLGQSYADCDRHFNPLLLPGTRIIRPNTPNSASAPSP